MHPLAITEQGTIYITDSYAGNVVQLKDKQLTVLNQTSFIYPNGIAYSEPNNCLYAAHFTGISIFHLSDSTIAPLKSNGKTYLTGIDGLYLYNNSLIAVQDAGNKEYRIVRFYLNKQGDSIVRTEILQSHHPDFDIPTTGTIANGYFYYIANSQLDHLTPEGTIERKGTLKRPLIMKIKLTQRKALVYTSY